MVGGLHKVLHLPPEVGIRTVVQFTGLGMHSHSRLQDARLETQPNLRCQSMTAQAELQVLQPLGQEPRRYPPT